MAYNLNRILTALVALGAFVSMTPASIAQELSVTAQRPNGISPLIVPPFYSWMNPDVSSAWAKGYLGQKTTITIVDDFRSPSGYDGNLAGSTQFLRHGEWTRLETSLVAPSATIKSKDFSTSNAAVTLYSGLNVLNLSYGMIAQDGYASMRWGKEESSIISYATNGKAVVSKAAGNDSVAVGMATADGTKDYLSAALIGTKSTIFVGALDYNGTTDNPASMAWYSNTAGSSLAVQSHFLVVGVEGDATGLYGTSFAAPIIAGYAAIVGSKFTTATPTAIVNDLLRTARTDTLSGYSAGTYGMGEASLGRALAPTSIK